MGPFDSRITNQPRQIQKPMCRQAFRPGQWGSTNSGVRSTTYIQNNFYGTQANYRGWGDAWASYDNSNCGDCSDSGKPGVLGWIGLGAGVLGGLAGAIFGGKKTDAPEEKGAPETPGGNTVNSTGNETEPSVTVNPNTVNPGKDEPAAAIPGKDEPAAAIPGKDEAVAEPSVDNFDWNNGFTTYAMDEEVNGKSPTETISGKVKVTEKGAEGKAPKTFTIADGSNTYTFKKVETASGKVQYECTGVTGGKSNTYTKGNKYDCNLVNGKPVLIQPKGTDGWGMGLDSAQWKIK